MAPTQKAHNMPAPAPDWSWVALEQIQTLDELQEDHILKATGLYSSRSCVSRVSAYEQHLSNSEAGERTEENAINECNGDDNVAKDREANLEKGKETRRLNGSEKITAKLLNSLVDNEHPPCRPGSWCKNNLLCLNGLGAEQVSNASPLHLE